MEFLLIVTLVGTCRGLQRPALESPWAGGRRSGDGGCMSLSFGCRKSLARLQGIVPPIVGKEGGQELDKELWEGLETRWMALL